MNHIHITFMHMETGDPAAAVESLSKLLMTACLSAAPAPAPPPPPSAPLARPAPAKSAVAKRKTPKPAVAKPAATSPARSDSQSRDMIIAALRKRPMTSGELIKATGLVPSTVYSMLGYLREKGQIKSVKTDGSIYPLQTLQEANNNARP